MTNKDELVSAILSLPKDVQREIANASHRRESKQRKNDPDYIKRKREADKRFRDTHKTITPFSMSAERMEEIKRKAKGEE
jgi:hypothetical protein